MLLFVAAIQAIPQDIDEAAMVDGAGYWQRVRRITLPLTARTILLVTLFSVIGSLLAFDQFFLMTAGQPFNQTASSVFWMYLNSFPVSEARLRRGAVAHPRGDHPRLHGGADVAHPQDLCLTSDWLTDERNRRERRIHPCRQPRKSRRAASCGQAQNGRTKYLVGAACIALCVIMLAPLVLTVLASLKSTIEQAAIPPTYFTHALSLDSYAKLWTYQDGLPTYLFNSAATAVLAIAFSLVLTIPAGYALARFPIPGKEFFFVFLLLALIIPYQALITPIFFMFATLKLPNTLVGLAIIHTAIHVPFSIYIMRNSFEAVPRELEEAAVIDGCSSWQVLIRIYLPAIRPAIVTVSLFAFVTSWNEFLAALVIMNRGVTFTLPLVLAAARQETSIGGTDWGLLQAGVTIAVIPCILFYVLLQKYYVSGFLSGAVK